MCLASITLTVTDVQNHNTLLLLSSSDSLVVDRAMRGGCASGSRGTSGSASGGVLPKNINIPANSLSTSGSRANYPISPVDSPEGAVGGPAAVE